MDLKEPLLEFGGAKPIFGTCAGAILLATDVTNPQQESLGLMRFGLWSATPTDGRSIAASPPLRRMRNSSEGVGDGSLEAVFIRAPKILRAGEGVKILAEFNGDPVLVEQGRHLAATFHPELTGDPRVHRLFLRKI